MSDARIMVVEDEAIVAEEIRSRLTYLKYGVPAVAASGEEAVKLAEETFPDLVLMDIRLKGDMDGVNAAEEIRSRFNIPVVYLTAYADDETLQRAKLTEPYGYILKPFKEKDLRTNIEIALHKHSVETQLKENALRLATTLKSMDDAVITTDTNGIVIFMNPLAETLTGWKCKRALGEELMTTFTAEDEQTYEIIPDPTVKVVREGIVVSQGNCVLISKDGVETPIDFSAAPIKDDAGNITGVVLVFRDVAERKWIEEKLQGLYKEQSNLHHQLEIEMRKTIDFTRTLADELKSPLTPVLMSSQVLASELKQEPLLSLAKNISRNATNLNDRIDDLLDLARGEVGALELGRDLIDLSQLLDIIVDNVAPPALARGYTLDSEIAPSLPMVRGDELRLRQIMLNLLENAFRLTPEGGIVALKAWETGTDVIVEVQYAGPGIAKEEQRRLFSPYARSKGEKNHISELGLGLALCKMLVELQGGRIWAKSEPRNGSAFGFSLPLGAIS